MAVKDLTELKHYIAERADVEVADAYIRRIEALCRSLADSQIAALLATTFGPVCARSFSSAASSSYIERQPGLFACSVPRMALDASRH